MMANGSLWIWSAWVLLSAFWLWTMPRPWGPGWWYPLLPVGAGAVLVLAEGTFGDGLLAHWLLAAVWLWCWLTVVWLISLVKRDASIMDIAFGYLLLALPWWLWWQLGGNPLAWPLLALSTLGFGRYSLYITWRNLPHGEDPRYARWRQRGGARWWWWSYFQIFLLQGVVLWLWVMPLVASVSSPQPLGPWHLLGALVWLMGFVFEAGGDWQLTRFKRTRTSSTQLLDTGLWAFTRHPNYFGQTAMWWGYAIVALASPWGWLGLASAAYITWFMYRGSATSLMERHMQKTKPGYAAYCERVPAFFPRWPRPRATTKNETQNEITP